MTKKTDFINDILQALEFYRDSGDVDLKTLSKIDHLLSVGSKHRLPKIEVYGRRWFQKTYGNTYNSVRIYVDDKEIAYLPFNYGYGDHYRTIALEHLESIGILPEKISKIASYQLRESYDITYHVEDVDRKRDL